MLARHVLASGSTAEAQGELDTQDSNLPGVRRYRHLRRKPGLSKGDHCRWAGHEALLPLRASPRRSTPVQPMEQNASSAPERALGEACPLRTNFSQHSCSRSLAEIGTLASDTATATPGARLPRAKFPKKNRVSGKLVER